MPPEPSRCRSATAKKYAVFLSLGDRRLVSGSAIDMGELECYAHRLIYSLHGRRSSAVRIGTLHLSLSNWLGVVAYSVAVTHCRKRYRIHRTAALGTVQGIDNANTSAGLFNSLFDGAASEYIHPASRGDICFSSARSCVARIRPADISRAGTLAAAKRGIAAHHLAPYADRSPTGMAKILSWPLLASTGAIGRGRLANTPVITRKYLRYLRTCNTPVTRR